jgi:hypothetical protein
MTARIDFLRLASWDYEAYPHTLSAIMKGWPGDWTQGSWLQYKGWRKEGFFIGHGQQGDRRHHVINVSGNLANKLYKSLLQREQWYATRLDVQITIPRPDGLELPEVHKRVGKIKSTLITSEKNDTLYLGTRTNSFFTRLYEKPLGEMFLRLEFELKSHRSKDAWRALKMGRTADEIFQYYLGKVKLPEDIKQHYVNVDEDITGLASRAEIDSDNQKILDWLRSLDKAMMRHMENHDIRDEVKEIVQAWANYATLIDIEEREC